MQKKVDWKALIISIAISLGIGFLSSFLAQNSMEVYMPLVKPPLSPPAWLFPVVWTILYILMGVSAYWIYKSDADEKEREKALSLYAFQLFFNFLWPIAFFNLGNYLLAFIILVILWLLIIAMIRQFYKIDKKAALLQIPYLLWVSFAGYLNLAIYLLNK